MPIPKPKKNENQSQFMQRCMHAVGNEFSSNEQAVAVCMTTWRNRNKKPKKEEKPIKRKVL